MDEVLEETWSKLPAHLLKAVPKPRALGIDWGNGSTDRDGGILQVSSITSFQNWGGQENLRSGKVFTAWSLQVDMADLNRTGPDGYASDTGDQDAADEEALREAQQQGGKRARKTKAVIRNGKLKRLTLPFLSMQVRAWAVIFFDSASLFLASSM